jgi:hypothetical protein
MHLNREYVYDGKQYELKKLFVIRDITDETAALIQDVRDLIRGGAQAAREAHAAGYQTGSLCTNPFGGEFYDVSNKPLSVDHVADLPGITPRILDVLPSRACGPAPDDPAARRSIPRR